MSNKNINVKTKIEMSMVTMSSKIPFKLIVFFELLVFCLFLASCNTTSLNGISTKIVKNEVTGKEEEYRLIKIYEDEKNDYFLEIKIPNGYNEGTARFSKESFVYEFFRDDEDYKMLKKSVFTIGEIYLTRPDKHSLSDYVNMRDFYFLDNFQVKFRERKLDDWDTVGNWSPKSTSLIYEYDCPKVQMVCFQGEEGVFALKAFEGKTLFWTVEYIAPVVPLPTYKSRKEILETSRDIIENCCKIIAVERVEKAS